MIRLRLHLVQNRQPLAGDSEPQAGRGGAARRNAKLPGSGPGLLRKRSTATAPSSVETSQLFYLGKCDEWVDTFGYSTLCETDTASPGPGDSQESSKSRDQPHGPPEP